MFRQISITIFLFSVLSVSIFSCNREKRCFDEALFQKHKNDACTKDCPGFTGCDDKFYCNECIALTQGIGKK
jgi:hypothetical protein